MARSHSIYIVFDDTHEEVVAAYTVKHEMITDLADMQEEGKRAWTRVGSVRDSQLDTYQDITATVKELVRERLDQRRQLR